MITPDTSSVNVSVLQVALHTYLVKAQPRHRNGQSKRLAMVECARAGCAPCVSIYDVSANRCEREVSEPCCAWDVALACAYVLGESPWMVAEYRD